MRERGKDEILEMGDLCFAVVSQRGTQKAIYFQLGNKLSRNSRWAIR